MTVMRRLLGLFGLLGLVALITSSRSFGDNPTGKQAPAAGAQVQVDQENALAQSKFAQGGVVTYRNLQGEDLFALQLQPKLDKIERRNRDYLVLMAASAAQAGEPWQTAQQIVKSLITDAKEAGQAPGEDRISIWVVSTPEVTQCLTKDFLSPRDPKEARKLDSALVDLKEKIWPAGTTDLKKGLSRAIESFAGVRSRQQIIIFLGDGQRTHDAISAADRTNLIGEMVQRKIGFYSVPLGANLNPENLHGFATGTGGTVIRVKPDENPIALFHEAFAVPVMYDAQLKLPAEVVEAYPQQLPPLRSDTPTLIVGRMKPLQTLSYSVSGSVPGGPGQVIAVGKETVRAPEVDNYFLNSMVNQWSRAKAQPALIRADRALAFAYEQTRLQHQELLLSAQIAVERNELDAALRLFEEARQLAPHDGAAASGVKVVQNLKTGKLTPDAIKEIEKAHRKGQKLEKVNGVVRWTAAELTELAQVEQEQKAPAEKVEGQDLLKAHRDRIIIEEQKMSQMVDANLRQARRELNSDPDAALELLRVTLSRVNDHPDLSERVRDALRARLETGLREVTNLGRAVKQREAEKRAAIATANVLENKEAQRKSFEERVEAQFRVFRTLMNSARVEEKTKHDLIYALEALAAEAKLKGEPVPQVAKAAYDQTLAGYNLRKQQDLKRLREERFLAVYLEVEKSHVPYPDEPGIYFPPLATWKAIRDLRKEKYEVSSLPDDPDARKEANTVSKMLAEVIDMKDFQQPMTLKDALGLFYDKFAAKGKELPILIDTAAFKEENPEAADIYDTPIQFPPYPKQMSMATALRLALSKVPTNNATYLIRRNYIEITTNERLLRQKVLRVYPVADLVIPISQLGGGGNFFQGGSIGVGGAIGVGGGIGAIGGQIGAFGAAGGALGQFGAFGAGGIGQIGGALGQFGAFGAGGIGQIGGALGQFGQFGAQFGQFGQFGAQFGAIGQLGNVGAVGQFGAAGIGGAFGFGAVGGFSGVPGSFQGGSFQGGFNGSLGQFGASQAVSLISTITKVVAPGEWFVTQQPNPFQQNVFFPFGGQFGMAGQFGNMGGMFGMMGGGPPPPPVSEGGPADIQQANTIEFFPPALALIVRGTSRIHTSLTSGIIGGKKARQDLAAAIWDAREGGKDVIAGGNKVKVGGRDQVDDPKNKQQIVKIDTKGKTKEELDPTKIWNEALAKEDVDPGMIIATADFLFEAGKFDHAAEFLKANLRRGIVVRPWVYEALAVALEASNGDREEIRRARLSAVALDPKDAQGFLEAARTMAEHKEYDRALAFCRQAALLEPNLAQPYTQALAYADAGKDSKAMEWAAGKLISQDWPRDDLALHSKASDSLRRLAGVLAKDNRKSESDRLKQALTFLKQRDLKITLTWETAPGENADVELEVREPTGSVCSSRQKQTPGGGTLLGTDLMQMTSSAYVAAQAFPGDYEITVHRNWGKPLGNRARLEIIQNYGTDKEVRRLEIVRLDQKQTFKVHLTQGRRTELAVVAPQAPPKPEPKDLPTGNPLVKLREMAMPDFSGATGPRGAAASPGARVPTEAMMNRPQQQPVYQSPVTSLGSAGMNLTAQVRLSGTGDANLVLQPVFQTVGNNPRPAVNLPLIPGGSN